MCDGTYKYDLNKQRKALNRLEKSLKNPVLNKNLILFCDDILHLGTSKLKKTYKISNYLRTYIKTVVVL